MIKIELLIIPGQPQAKARPRITKFGAYTPEKTLNYEALIKQIYQANKFTHHGEAMLKMELTAYYEIPKSASKKKAEQMLSNVIMPTKKPDLDNICKIVTDALNGIAYKDDSQIVEIHAKKLYSDIPEIQVMFEII